MRVAVGLVTCQREALRARTLESLGMTGFELHVIDNSIPHPGLPALGFARAMAAILNTAADIIVLSPDDMVYRPGWLSRLVTFWGAAPRAVALTGHCLLPVFRWSVPYGGLEAGGIQALLRPTTIAAWSFRREDAELVQIEVIPSGWEKAICRRVMAAGRLVCEIDLAEHIGATDSSLGHDWSIATPLTPHRERWLQ